ncbi:cytochrome P450 monooxygenase-like protein [Corynespora cassiicola Philippines]|uniref:Cytochrome P450 monooxygenase-like protein n=1 Tax=Corynespora cassiicola Philippines TaxID=1448308 RepID=A0A2T2NJ21_CORCC|nr:cytochrome P450 monooxygenase-like protein [Corynespora cassiicola Philippines]
MLAIFLSIAAGLVAHHGVFIRGEWHLRTRIIAATHAILALVSFSALRYNSNTSKEALLWLLTVCGCYLTTLFTSMSIYRLFFHPLSKFPGPRLAALTKFWHVYQSRNSTNYLVMDKVHKEYGALVRTGPNEVSIFHPGGIHLLDGAKNTNMKDTFYDVLKPRTSGIFTRDEQEHKDRRATWMQALSTKSMDEYKPRIVRLVDDLRKCISSFDKQPINVTDVMTWFSFDVMSEVLFGEDFGMIKQRATHPVMAQQKRALALLGPIMDTQWIVQLGFAFFPFFGKVRDWMRMCTFCEGQMTKRMTHGGRGKLDMASWFIDEYHALRDSESEKKRKLLLSGSAVSAVVAGSDTNRGALIAIWWYLSKHPEHAAKIQNEIADIDVTDANNLALLPHLNGVINEVLRLAPPAMTGNGRITGPDGLLVDDTLIPPNVRITAPKYVIHRLDCAFEHANDFIPERWYSHPELVHDKRAFAPFSIGGRQCVGKILALVELRLTTAILLQHFDIKFAPGYDPDTMWRGMKDQVTAQPGRVLCTFKPREL